MSHDEAWHEARRSHIGGSDAAAICGLSKWRTAYEVYLEKIGELPPHQIDPDLEEFGHAHEETIVKVYCKRTGATLLSRNERIIDTRYDFMGAELDALVDLDASQRIVEAKSGEWGPQWGSRTEQILPEHIQIQVQHQLAVTGLPVADVAALIGSRDFRIYTVERDEDLIRSLRLIEERFWKRVVDRDPPEPEFEHRSTADLLKRLHAGTNGLAINLPESARFWHMVMVEAGEQVKQYQAVKDGAKNHLLHLMGDAAIARIPGLPGQYTRKMVKKKAYTVEPSEYMDFRYSQKDKE